MISDPAYDGDGNLIAHVTVSAAAAFADSFEIGDGTRPLAPDWVKLQLEIRPDFDHPDLIRRLSTLASDPEAASAVPEIVVHDADRAVFSFKVAQPVIAALLRHPDGSAARYSQILRALYLSSADTREIWRGDFVVMPGRAP
jgi:hypothetical protein